MLFFLCLFEHTQGRPFPSKPPVSPVAVLELVGSILRQQQKRAAARLNQVHQSP